jgi:hypothetical protein
MNTDKHRFFWGFLAFSNKPVFIRVYLLRSWEVGDSQGRQALLVAATDEHPLGEPGEFLFEELRAD